jgi:hypothetical protein
MTFLPCPAICARAKGRKLFARTVSHGAQAQCRPFEPRRHLPGYRRHVRPCPGESGLVEARQPPARGQRGGVKVSRERASGAVPITAGRDQGPGSRQAMLNLTGVLSPALAHDCGTFHALACPPQRFANLAAVQRGRVEPCGRCPEHYDGQAATDAPVCWPSRVSLIARRTVASPVVRTGTADADAGVEQVLAGNVAIHFI